MKRVSVIVPVYNMEAYLSTTLDSILASDYGDFEVVLMDDGSCDRSPAIARSYAERDPRVHAYAKPNGGVSTARNAAIRLSTGDYILPVDADNTIEPDFIGRAARVLDMEPDVLVVAPTSDFFGERTGIWRLPKFRLSLLARKNIMDNCAMYRRRDYDRVGGYCEQIVTREDWAFWIGLLQHGGRVVRLPQVLHHYRIRGDSKRVTHRHKLHSVIDKLNELYPDFFRRQLYGPLRYRRSWSKLINILSYPVRYSGGKRKK